jgi:hypothetical protein
VLVLRHDGKGWTMAVYAITLPIVWFVVVLTTFELLESSLMLTTVALLVSFVAWRIAELPLLKVERRDSRRRRPQN